MLSTTIDFLLFGFLRLRRRIRDFGAGGSWSRSFLGLRSWRSSNDLESGRGGSRAPGGHLELEHVENRMNSGQKRAK